MQCRYMLVISASIYSLLEPVSLLKARMSAYDIGALDAFSAKAGPLPRAKRIRDNDDDERSSWAQSQSMPKSQGSEEQERGRRLGEVGMWRGGLSR